MEVPGLKKISFSITTTVVIKGIFFKHLSLNLAIVGYFTKSGRTPVYEVTEGINTMLDAEVLVICR